METHSGQCICEQITQKVTNATCDRGLALASVGPRASIGEMPAIEVHEHTIDDAAAVFYFARVYADDRSSRAAYDRARAGISEKLNTSVFRVVRPADGRHLLFVVSGTLTHATRAAERVAWGGEEYRPTADEMVAVGARLREVAQAGGLNSQSSWSGVGGLGLGREGSRGATRRPEG